MIFEFDKTKSLTNRDKHGIDFVEAQALWEGDFLIVKAKFITEERWVHIGKIAGKHWSAVITYRGDVIRFL